MRDSEKSHIQAMISYLESAPLAAHTQTISSELDKALSRTGRDDEVITGIINLGHPRFLKTLIDTHGPLAFSGSLVCPIRMLPFYPDHSSAQTLKSMRLLMPFAFSNERQRADRIMRMAAHYDDPEFLLKACSVTKITPLHAIGALSTRELWGSGKPAITAWITEQFENHFDPKEPEWRLAIHQAVRNPLPATMAAFFRLGVDLRNELEKNGDMRNYPWLQEVNDLISSSHGRMALMQRLPSVHDCLMIPDHEVISLILSRPTTDRVV